MTTYKCKICNEIKTEDLEPSKVFYILYGLRAYLMCTECSEKRKESIEEFNLEPD